MIEPTIAFTLREVNSIQMIAAADATLSVPGPMF